MQEDDEQQQQLIQNPVNQAFDENGGQNVVEEEFTCEVRILCRKNGCGKVFKEKERSRIKLCICFDQKQATVCKKCEKDLKEKARKRHFWIPALLFMIVNVIVWMILIIIRLDEMQEV